MSFQIASDLHLDINGSHRLPKFLKPVAPTLILAGDICQVSRQDIVNRVLTYVSQHWKNVIYVIGNHEYYDLGISRTEEILRSCIRKYPNVHLLQKKSLVIDGFTILGTTLWTKLDDDSVLEMLSDRTKIPMTLPLWQTLYSDQLGWLQNEISLHCPTNKPLVIVTHHAPIRETTSDPVYQGTKLNHAFANDLDDVLLDLPPGSIWIHGHTHWSHDDIVNDVRVVSNQYGYWFATEYEGFMADKVVSL